MRCSTSWAGSDRNEPPASRCRPERNRRIAAEARSTVALVAGRAGFVEAVLEAPLGVALLARLESRARFPDGWAPLGDTSVDGVNAAVALVETMEFGELIELATYSAVIDVGPWISEAPGHAALAYRDAEGRAPIAVAIEARFGHSLHRPLDFDAQQWWVTAGAWDRKLAPLFRDFEHVYDAGEFTWAGLWTVSDPPEVAHAQLVDAWEMYDGPVTRWGLPVDTGSEVFEINRPGDWTRLVTDHPREAASHGKHWELPGINQDRSAVSSLMDVPGQRAARTSIRSHIVPDWRSVAEHYDGVHLTWAGLITADGCISDLGHGDVAMLRYWFSERTLWLADVFGPPSPLAPPHLPDDSLSDGSPATVSAPDSDTRRRRDLSVLAGLLDRPLDS